MTQQFDFNMELLSENEEDKTFTVKMSYDALCAISSLLISLERARTRREDREEKPKSEQMFYEGIEVAPKVSHQ